MGIDIGYLLFLQNLRNATGGVFDEFFNAISKVAVSTMELLPFLVFWGSGRFKGRGDRVFISKRTYDVRHCILRDDSSLAI